MANEITPDIATVNELRFRRASFNIPANGVLVVGLVEGAAITITGGASALYGIKYVDEDGIQITLGPEFTGVKFIRAAPGVTVTIMHNATVDIDAQPIPVEQRLLTSSLKAFTLETVNAQAFYGYAPAPISGFRWFFVDRLNFDPANPEDWNPLPASMPAALNQLAARSPVIASDSVEIVSGVPTTLWSYTLAEGEVIGGLFKLTGGLVDAGVTKRTRGSLDFGASRSVGGVAEISDNTAPPVESGTIADGELEIVAVGNDVEIQVTFSATALLTYTRRLEFDSVIIPQP